MEPFGLFSLLQSLLSPENNQNEQKSEPISSSQEPDPQPNFSSQEQKSTQQSMQASDAFLLFLDEHERRAKRTRPKK